MRGQPGRGRAPGERRGHLRGAVSIFGLLALAALVAAPGCGGSSTSAAVNGTSIVFVQVPADGTPSLTSRVDFRDPYPPGSRLAIWDPKRPGEPPRVLTEGFEAAGGPAVSHDGRRLLFCGRRTARDPWRIYEVAVEGGGPVAVSPEGANATRAAYLGKWGMADTYAERASEYVVFSSDLERTRDPRDGGAAFSLYTCRRDGSGIGRITFNPGSDIDPTVLGDGRILYSAWQPPGHGRPRGAWALFTVLNDGTQIFPFYGSHHPPAIKWRPREVGRRVVFLSADASEGGARLQAVSLSRPLHSLDEIGPPAGSSWRSAELWDRETLLVSARPSASGEGPRATFGLYRVPLSGKGEPTRVLDDPGMDEVDACLIRSRPPPNGHVSNVRPEKGTGELLCLDARITDRTGSAGRDPRTARKLRVWQGLPMPLDETSDPGEGLPYEVPSKLLTTVELARDGSVILEVPGDTPLRFETVDAEGRTVLDSKGWAWVRPGNGRSCIGCHEDREMCPPNRVPEVVAIGSAYQEEQRKRRTKPE